MLAGALLSASGCGAGESREESQLLPRDLGADLVRRAERVTASIENGDGCKAQRQAAQLRRIVSRAIAQKRVPPELQGELRRRSSGLAGSVVCVQPPPPPPPPRPKRGDGEGEEEDD